MAFRIVSIEHSSELHVTDGQLRVVREDAECTIPLADIIMVVCMGANIRISTMALGLLAESSVMVLILGRNHMPQSMVVPMVSNARQAKVTAAQVAMTRKLRDEIWQRIVKQKIANQSRALAIAGLKVRRSFPLIRDASCPATRATPKEPRLVSTFNFCILVLTVDATTPSTAP